MGIIEAISNKINHSFIEDENIDVELAAGCDGRFYPLDILDYVYAVLCCIVQPTAKNTRSS
jgi:hypothetical protein